VVFDFQWSDDSEAHIAKHGVTPEEVEQATERPFYTMPGRGSTTLLLGQTHAGRHLLVVLAGSGDGRWHVVTARTMTDSERRLFSKKAK
jgi:uncharacterized DUF497 family protein